MDLNKLDDRLLSLAEKAKQTFWGYLGCELVSMDAHKVVVSLEVEEHHLNLIGIMHGGVHTSLLDSAMGLVAMAARPNEDMVTSNLNIHFTAPAVKGKVTAIAEIVHMSGKMITTQGTLINEQGTLCSMATASFRVIETKHK
ncbi:PaaI family thioesterase [Paenibacillus abyssi]|uniref:Thioesterase domain-containing protein n=1 Tax=Paenibacillus abyssi TaxID=1340531 RepID=A0A917CXH5_9BACL|nr:PaaI family thioesterase [Paenibacillus abyssi]GGG03320.1 hypothetical protein GCM10010916_20520 [Paenibacillus abyssi]